ncbi:MAG: DUF433 domain-containing protein [Deltaproteobacteria bacterium]
MSAANAVLSSRRLAIGEAALVSGVSPDRINQLIDAKVLAQDVVVSVHNTTYLRAKGCIITRFVESEGNLVSEHLRERVMQFLAMLQFNSAGPVIYEEGNLKIDLSVHVAAVLKALADLDTAYSLVIEDPDLWGGRPTVRGTQIGAHDVAHVLKTASIREARKMYPSISKRQLELIRVYASARPRPASQRKSGLTPVVAEVFATAMN